MYSYNMQEYTACLTVHFALYIVFTVCVCVVHVLCVCVCVLCAQL